MFKLLNNFLLIFTGFEFFAMSQTHTEYES